MLTSMASSCCFLKTITVPWSRIHYTHAHILSSYVTHAIYFASVFSEKSVLCEKQFPQYCKTYSWIVLMFLKQEKVKDAPLAILKRLNCQKLAFVSHPTNIWCCHSQKRLEKSPRTCLMFLPTHVTGSVSILYRRSYLVLTRKEALPNQPRPASNYH